MASCLNDDIETSYMAANKLYDMAARTAKIAAQIRFSF